MLDEILDFFRPTPRRTFVLFPLVSLMAALLTQGRGLRLHTRFLPLLPLGYAQYRLIGQYLRHRGRGDFNPANPPTQLVTSGPYALTRNPMYLGHLLFMLGLSLTLRTRVAIALTVLHAAWFHWKRVAEDERLMEQRYGEAYREYKGRVKRWLPGVF